MVEPRGRSTHSCSSCNCTCFCWSTCNQPSLASKVPSSLYHHNVSASAEPCHFCCRAAGDQLFDTVPPRLKTKSTICTPTLPVPLFHLFHDVLLWLLTLLRNVSTNKRISLCLEPPRLAWRSLFFSFSRLKCSSVRSGGSWVDDYKILLCSGLGSETATSLSGKKHPAPTNTLKETFSEKARCA